ncbi:MAG: hypothetical protein A2219_04380 [Elusimicrobia bacterium RIFOXYA2_FULL_50_26]|nr:MAG: hypothetical protein A2219_04380 [Elusimicrobia bacterium RIFOXYA2_FULL_50_26]
MKKYSVLLLNPPGGNLYIRDYFCSKVSQADYIHHPVDLMVLSGIIAAEHEVSVIDAIAGNISVQETLRRIVSARPDVIVSLAGAVSIEEDTLFLQKVKEALPQVRIVCIGDVFGGNTASFLRENAFVDAVLFNFSTDDILRYISGDRKNIRNMALRAAGGGITITPRETARDSFEIPVPKHELFAEKGYRYPFVRRKKFATILTEYGCPFPCSFCIIGTLGHRVRTPGNVIKELRHVRSLGIRELLFMTQTFGAARNEAQELCRLMIEEKFNFGWTCFSRVDVATPELMALMKQAGCHTIIFGIESGSDKILASYRKGYTSERITATLKSAAGLGIETVGTFILGLPDESPETMESTIELLKNSKLDFASFNVAVPRENTPLRGEAIKLGLIDEGFEHMDQSGNSIAMPTKSLSREEILGFRRRAVRMFYFRPAYIFRQLKKIRSLYDAARLTRQAANLIRRTWKE